MDRVFRFIALIALICVQIGCEKNEIDQSCDITTLDEYMRITSEETKSVIDDKEPGIWEIAITNNQFHVYKSLTLPNASIYDLLDSLNFDGTDE